VSDRPSVAWVPATADTWEGRLAVAEETARQFRDEGREELYKTHARFLNDLANTVAENEVKGTWAAWAEKQGGLPPNPWRLEPTDDVPAYTRLLKWFRSL
jgi:hypothetical protein